MPRQIQEFQRGVERKEERQDRQMEERGWFHGRLMVSSSSAGRVSPIGDPNNERIRM